MTVGALNPLRWRLALVLLCMHYSADLLHWQWNHAGGDLFIRNNKTPAKPTHCGATDSAKSFISATINHPGRLRQTEAAENRGDSNGTVNFRYNYIQLREGGRTNTCWQAIENLSHSQLWWLMMLTENCNKNILDHNKQRWPLDCMMYNSNGKHNVGFHAPYSLLILSVFMSKPSAGFTRQVDDSLLPLLRLMPRSDT